VSPIVEVEALTKRFGALAAVNDITFRVEQGETYGIAGTNGAGKTTLFDVISGHARATSGVVRFDGREIQNLPAYAICERGVARTYQVPVVFPSQTVLGNVLVGAFFGHRRSWPTAIRYDSTAIDRAADALAFVGLVDQVGTMASLLSAFDRKRLMLASALATHPRVLMLDEPAAGLNAEEEEQIVALVETAKGSGITVMIIEHVMSVLMRVSDRVLAMHQGARIFEGTPAEFREHPEVMRVYLGIGVATAVSESVSEERSRGA
jgi:branched-chain amino acid transport system ATP-binding protein